jgi:cytochrome c551
MSIDKHKQLLVYTSFKISALRFKLLCFTLLASSFVLSCNRSATENRSSKFTQYYNQGEELYLKNCSNCHQKNGKGLGRVYPPLDSSDYLLKNFNDVICLMEHGKKGSLTVNGVEFNQAMPGVPTLTDLEVAYIATYIYNTWSNSRGIVDVKEVTPILESCVDLE